MSLTPLPLVAEAANLTVVRMFAYGVGYGYQLQESPGVSNASAFKDMDFIVSEASNRGLKLLISLSSNWIYGANTTGTKYAISYLQFTIPCSVHYSLQSVTYRNRYTANNLFKLDDAVCLSQFWLMRCQQKSCLSPYCRCYYTNYTTTASTCDDFFTDTNAIQLYKDWVKTITSRNNSITGVTYGNDPTIFGWDLINEPRCDSTTDGCSAAGIQVRLICLNMKYPCTQETSNLSPSIWVTYILADIWYLPWKASLYPFRHLSILWAILSLAMSSWMRYFGVCASVLAQHIF